MSLDTVKQAYVYLKKLNYDLNLLIIVKVRAIIHNCKVYRFC